MEETEGINKDCYCNGLRRKPECNIETNGGLYKIMNIRQYLEYQESQDPTLKLIITNKGDKNYIHLFRSCEYRDTSIVDGRGTYDDEWEKLKNGKRRSTFAFLHLLSNITTERLGWEPGIGINVGLQESVPESYMPGRLISDGINHLHKIDPKNFPSVKLRDYDDLKDSVKLNRANNIGRVYIYELLVELSDDILVCAINRGCQWNQITCDKKTSDEYHLIGHLESNYELNILAKCPYIIVGRKLYKNNFGEPELVTTELLDELQNASNYREKYLKYKIKYINLKKLSNKK